MDVMNALSTVTSSIKKWVNDNKVQKEKGKGLSTNDYTNDDKKKVGQIDNMPNDLVVLDGKLYLAKDGKPFEDSVVVLPEGGGGGGGSGPSVAITIENKLPSTTFVAASGSAAWIKFYFASTILGEGTAYIFVTEGNNNRTLKGSEPIINGQDNEIDVSHYLGSGINIVDIICADKYGNESSLRYTIDVIQLSITTQFSDSQVFTKETGIPISIKFNGDITKTIHFEIQNLDSKVKDYTITGITTNNGSVTYDILNIVSNAGDSLLHGTYFTKVYTTATTENGGDLISNVYTFDIMFNEGKTTPLISSVYDVTSITQGEQINIPFTVYHVSNLNPEVTLTIEKDGDVYLTDTRTVTSGVRQHWSTKNYPAGEVTFTISYSGVQKEHMVVVSPSTIKQKVRTDNMKFYISASGKSNESADCDIWNGIDADKNVVATTDFTNVNWSVTTKKFSTVYKNDDDEEVVVTSQYAIGTGWAVDENGDTALRLSGDARAFIDFKPYAVDPKANGKTIELIFAIRDVNNRDAVAMSCMSNGVGFTVTSDTAVFTNGSTSAVCNYIDGEKLHITLVIEPKGTAENPNTRLFCAYLNGVMSSASQYTEDESLHQSSPVGISVGSSECSIDLYAIRTYDIALTKEEVRDNFIAESGDISLSVENDIYNGSAMLLSEVEKRIPVMRITGSLPSLKNDSNKKKGGKDFPVDIVYTDPINKDLNFTDTALIHVQGTSSERYPRKNWKIEFDNMHQHMPNMIPSDVFCMKTDFAENTGSHNTGNANYIHTLYDDVRTPPQEVDPRVRTTIAGFPCVIFHRKSSSDSYEFAGRYNFNYEKSSNNAYGLTDDYPDAESWEFRDNPPAPCQFIDSIPEDVDEWNGPMFEARFPDGSEDIANFRVAHEWVVSTNRDKATGDQLTSEYIAIDGKKYTHDTKEYRLAKFKTEFTEHFDLDFSLIYYLYTFVMLMVDQRAKNMFQTTWDGIHYQPWFYDNDTCLGIDNNGILKFDYYHQDYGDNSVLGVQDVFNGKPSVLWNNFHDAFADEIETLYRSWRIGGKEKLSYEKLVKYFITDQTDKWSISMYNDDAEFKYIDSLRTKNNPEYLPRVRGTGEEHFKYYTKNRLMFCDSKWFAGNYVAGDNRIVMRINKPNIVGKFAPNVAISYKTFSNMYATVRYGTNGIPITQYTPRDTLVYVDSDIPEYHDLDTYIFGADEISYLDDLSLLYCGDLNISAATKLLELNVGRDEDGYENPNLIGLSFTNNRLLRKVNVCNCTGFTSKVLDFSLCPNIQEVLATGSNITGINLPDSGYLKIAKLPATIENLKIVNQKHIQVFECENYENLKSIRIENSINVPVTNILRSIVDGKYPNVRIINMEWNVDSEEELSEIINKLINCKALDASGFATNDAAIVTGRVIVNGTVSDALRALVHKYFPDLVVVDNTGTTFYFIDYLTIDGEIYFTELVSDNQTPNGPLVNPSDIVMGDHQYKFAQWDMSSFKQNQNNRITGVWLEQFAIKYFNYDNELLHRQWATVGDAAEDPVGTEAMPDAPEKISTNADISYKFSGWDNLPANVQGTVNVYAQYDTYWAARYWNGGSKPHYTDWVLHGADAIAPSTSLDHTYTTPTRASTVDKDYTFNKWASRWSGSKTWLTVGEFDKYVGDGSKVITAADFTYFTSARDYIAVYQETTRKYTVKFYDDSGKLIPGYEYPLDYGSAPSKIPSNDPEKHGVDNPEEYMFKGWYPSTGVGITGDTIYRPLFKFTGYLFGKLGKTAEEDEGYGTIDNPNWDAINAYWNFIADDIESYKNGNMSENDFFNKYQIGGRMPIQSSLSEFKKDDKIFIAEKPVVDVEIIGHNHDYLSNGNDKASITFLCLDAPDIKYWMNDTDTNVGGWKDCKLRTFTNGELFNSFPIELQRIVKEVKKISDEGGGSNKLVETLDKCWIPSADEVNASGYDSSGSIAIEGQGDAYSSVFSSNASRLKYIVNTTEFARWRIRSACYPKLATFWRITNNTGGLYPDGNANNGHYIVFGFCI